MIANNLMINDWIYQALYQDTEIPNKGHGWKEVRVTTCPFDEDWAISPIPLTPKILEKNGWTLRYNYDREAYYSKDGEFFLDYLNGSFRIIIHTHTIQIKYVHQLQQILRFVGLVDIADDLKV